MLLEKAWAKLFGSYRRTQNGWPHVAFNHLTGVPAERIVHKELQRYKNIADPDALYSVIRQVDQKGGTIIGSSEGSGE